MTDRNQEQFSMRDPSTQTDQDRKYGAELGSYFENGVGSTVDKLRNFAKYVPRQSLSVFLAKHDLFRRHVVATHGHIVECGVYLGGGLMTWAQLSAIYEPVNHVRRVVGFDTFEGFPSLAHQDRSSSALAYAAHGGLATNARIDIEESVRLYDLNRSIGHIPRVELVVGNAEQTIPDYLSKNPHLVVAMLYLDFDLYAPTRAAIEAFVPRMPKGSVIAFDELDQPYWPGETTAVMESIGLRNLRIKRFSFTPALSYAVL